jgi:hypothetical protein
MGLEGVHQDRSLPVPSGIVEGALSRPVSGAGSSDPAGPWSAPAGAGRVRQSPVVASSRSSVGTAASRFKSQRFGSDRGQRGGSSSGRLRRS